MDGSPIYHVIALTAYMSFLGILEAVVHLWRIRSGNRESALSSALSAGAVQTLRVLGMVGVAVSAVEVQSAWPLVFYIIIPTVTTYHVHKHLVRLDK